MVDPAGRPLFLTPAPVSNFLVVDVDVVVVVPALRPRFAPVDVVAARLRSGPVSTERCTRGFDEPVVERVEGILGLFVCVLSKWYRRRPVQCEYSDL